MGDHRADIKIEFNFHGKTYKYDADLNWFPDVEGDWVIDERVVAFFRHAYEDGMNRYHRMIEKSREGERKAEEERRDKAELARLKAKYEP